MLLVKTRVEFVIAVVPGERDLHRHAVAFGLDHDGGGDQRVLGAVEIFHKGFQAALIMQHHFLGLDPAFVGQDDSDAGIEEGQLAQAMLERGVIEFGLGEGDGRGQEGDFGAAPGLAVLDGRVAHDLERRHRVAVAELHVMFLALAPDAQVQEFRQGIHHRHAHAMQAAGDLVGVLLEFSARMKLGHDHFGGGNTFFLMDAGGDAAAIVAHGAGAVGIEHDIDAVGVAGQGLVHRIVHHFIDHVVQARAVIGVADIHAGALAHRIQAFEHLDGAGAIFVGHLVRRYRTKPSDIYFTMIAIPAPAITRPAPLFMRRRAFTLATRVSSREASAAYPIVTAGISTRVAATSSR